MAKDIYREHGLIVTRFAGFGGIPRFQFAIENAYIDMDIDEMKDMIEQLKAEVLT